MRILLDRHIETTPDIRHGKPRIVGTRITVADLAIIHLHLGHSCQEIARKYQLPLAAVYAGMAYYFDHRAEIDQRIEADEAFADAFRRENSSLVVETFNAPDGE